MCSRDDRSDGRRGRAGSLPLIRTGDDDCGAVRVERLTGGGVGVLERDSIEQRRQSKIVIEPQAEEFGGLQKRRNGAVRLEQSRNGTDQVFLAVL